MRRHRNQAPLTGLGRARGVPADGPSGDRHKGGVSPVPALVVERGNLSRDAKGEHRSGDPTKGESTDARGRGGWARSSEERRHAAGAKGPTSRARGIGQPARGGADGPRKPLGSPVLRLDEPDEARVSRPVP